ncbi:MAG TPA: flagellar export chaperone FliS [Actinoplanes sp.]|nr:flagellar export chaperone FliS [Actinoplanes sp.]
MTNLPPSMRERYLTDSVATASPAKLLLMLFDRLVVDLNRGEQALVAGERLEANTHLQHAQDIVTELQVSLDLEAWDGAAGLASLYAFVGTELVNSNIRGDAAKVASVRGLIEPLRDTWREAAMAVAAAED